MRHVETSTHLNPTPDFRSTQTGGFASCNYQYVFISTSSTFKQLLQDGHLRIRPRHLRIRPDRPVLAWMARNRRAVSLLHHSSSWWSAPWLSCGRQLKQTLNSNPEMGSFCLRYCTGGKRLCASSLRFDLLYQSTSWADPIYHSAPLCHVRF